MVSFICYMKHRDNQIAENMLLDALKNAEENEFGIAKTKEGEAEINDYEVLQEARDILKKNGRSEWIVMRNASY